MKRILAIALLLVVAAPSVSSAAPADAVTIELTGVQRGSVVEGTVSFTVQASSAAGIKKLEVIVDDASVASVEPSGLKQKVEIPYDWTTGFYTGTAKLAPNGEYVIKAHAVANGGADKDLVATVIVDNPAAAPKGVEATTTKNGVGLTWAANPEPDLVGYQIERGDGTTYEPLAETTDTFFNDIVGPGDYVYRVIAVRNSSARSTGRPSLPSEPVNVSVAPPAAAQTGGRDNGDSPSLGGKGAADRGFKVRASSFAPRGLPSGIALPGSVGLPDLPETGVEWGTYEDLLPYELPKGGVQLAASMPSTRDFFSWSVIPADGLRWVAGGLLLLAAAALLKLIALRLDAITRAVPLRGR